MWPFIYWHWIHMPISAERADCSTFPCHTFHASLPIFQVTSHHRLMLREQQHPLPCAWTGLSPAHRADCAAAPKSALQRSFCHRTATSLSVLSFQKIPLIYVVTTTACCLITPNVCGPTGTRSGDGAPWAPSVTWSWLRPPPKSPEASLNCGDGALHQLPRSWSSPLSWYLCKELPPAFSIWVSLLWEGDPRGLEVTPKSPHIFLWYEWALPGFFTGPRKALVYFGQDFGKSSAPMWCLGCTCGMAVSGNTRAWWCDNVRCWVCSSAVACVAPADINRSRMCIQAEELKSLKQRLGTWKLSLFQGLFLPRTQQTKKSLLLVFVLIFFTDPGAVGSLRADPKKGFLHSLDREPVVRENYAVILGDTVKLSRRLSPRQLEAILNADFTPRVSHFLIFHEWFLIFNQPWSLGL